MYISKKIILHIYVGNKRKKEDPNYEPSGKRVKTNEEFKQARNDETESAAQNLQALLDE